MADCLTKKSERVPPDALVRAVRTGWLPNADKSQPFREMMRSKHKAFSADSLLLAEWCVRNIDKSLNVESILGVPIQQEIYYVYGRPDWYMDRINVPLDLFHGYNYVDVPPAYAGIV